MTDRNGPADALRRARVRANLTQAQLAHASGLSVRALRDLEHGRVARMRTNTVDRLAAALDLDDADRARLRNAVTSQAIIEILGPVHIGGAKPITSEARRMVLAILALCPGEVVHIGEIIDLLWEDRPPASCRTQVHGHIGQLRRLLDNPDVLRRVGDGYRLDVDGDSCDVVRFRGLLASAYNENGDEAMERYAQALRCWRGPVAADTPARLRRHPMAVTLAEQRIRAALDWADLAIERGARPVPPLLRELAHDEPFHEGLHARLMLALAACGEQAAALAVFEEIRTRLADQLGVAPGDELASAHVRVLRQQVRTRSRYVPAQLPGEAGVFVGRAEQIAQLDSPNQAVCAITGGAGVGKTALALRWAHHRRDRFPDGQIYVNLRGHASSTTAQPIDVLAQMLADLGVPAAEVPSGVDAAAALFRTVVADRRVLVVLDDAHDADQVRPLLPGGPGCVAVITSRHRLDGLIAYDGAVRLPLDVLPAEDSVALLSRVLGADRVAREPAAVTELADVCARLPLALRIAAAHLGDRPRYAISSYVAALSTEDTLAHLEVPGDDRTAVRVAFAASYRRLSAPARRLFALLGSAPPIEIDVLAATAIAGSPARDLLLELATYHLVAEVAPGRFACHDLLRAYAARCAHDEGVGTAGAQRLVEYYVDSIEAGARLLYPSILRLADDPRRTFASAAEASAWFTAEVPNIVATVLHCVRQADNQAAVAIAIGMRGYFSLGRDMALWHRVAVAAYAAAQADAAPRAEALAALNLAQSLTYRHHGRQALPHLHRAMRLCVETDWAEGQSASLNALAHLHSVAGRPRQAAVYLRRGIEVNRRLDRRTAEAKQLSNLGLISIDLGRLADARECFTRALATHRRDGHSSDEVGPLNGLIDVLVRLGDASQAILYAHESIAICDEYGRCEAGSTALARLSAAYRLLGRWDDARAAAERAYALAVDNDDPRTIAHALVELAVLDGDPDRAARRYTEALALLRAGGSTAVRVDALTGLAAVELARGRYAPSVARAQEALDLSRQCDYRPGVAQARLALERGRRVPAPPVQAVTVKAARSRTSSRDDGPTRSSKLPGSTTR